MITGTGTPSSNYDFNCYNAAGQVWNGSAFVAYDPDDFLDYRIPATEQGPSIYTADEPEGTVQWFMYFRGLTLETSLMRDKGTIVVTPSDLAAAMLGGGSNDVPILVLDENDVPIPGVFLRAKLNNSVQAQGYTDDDGTITFALDSGAYRLVGERTGFESPGLLDMTVPVSPSPYEYQMTTSVSESPTVPGTVVVKVNLAKMGVAQTGVMVYISLTPDTVQKLVRLGTQYQYLGEVSAKTDTNGIATFNLPTSDVLEAAGAERTYQVHTMNDYIPQSANATFEVPAGGGFVTITAS